MLIVGIVSSQALVLTGIMDWVLLGAGRWCSSILVLTALVLVATAVLRRYFSAISDVPGPFWAAITRLWHIYYIYNGDHNTRVMKLHEKHGHFVRIAPNEVSISHPDGPDLLLQKPLRKVRQIMPVILSGHSIHHSPAVSIATLVIYTNIDFIQGRLVSSFYHTGLHLCHPAIYPQPQGKDGKIEDVCPGIYSLISASFRSTL